MDSRLAIFKGSKFLQLINDQSESGCLDFRAKGVTGNPNPWILNFVLKRDQRTRLVAKNKHLNSAISPGRSRMPGLKSPSIEGLKSMV
jgi:hypothetical protein